MKRRRVLVCAGNGWHRGVIGIVASRLVERFHRPALVISIEDGTAQGSGRSIPSFHLLNALDQASSLFDRYGGHAQAAGFSLPPTKIAELADLLESYAQTTLTEQDLEPELRVDCRVSLDDIDWAMLAELKKLEPCGYGNPKPVFSTTAKLELPPLVMKEKHLKLRVAGRGRVMDAVGWNMASRFFGVKAGQELELAFTVEENRFFEEPSIQLVVRDIRAGGGAAINPRLDHDDKGRRQ